MWRASCWDGASLEQEDLNLGQDFLMGGVEAVVVSGYPSLEVGVVNRVSEDCCKGAEGYGVTGLLGSGGGTGNGICG